MNILNTGFSVLKHKLLQSTIKPYNFNKLVPSMTAISSIPSYNLYATKHFAKYFSADSNPNNVNQNQNLNQNQNVNKNNNQILNYAIISLATVSITLAFSAKYFGLGLLFGGVNCLINGLYTDNIYPKFLARSYVNGFLMPYFLIGLALIFIISFATIINIIK
jgi:ABC-type antimicrobial peptide transport system permease subunit